jgi:hypothetical protein
LFALFCQQEHFFLLYSCFKNGGLYIYIKKITFYGKKRFIYGKNSCRNLVKGRSCVPKLRKKVIKTMTYKTSEFKITLKNFEVEELFNHFDVFGLQEIELDNGDFVYPENDEIRNVTLAIEKAI